MTTLNRSRIDQVIETIRAVHEQAPGLAISVCVSAPTQSGFFSYLTLEAGRVTEDTIDASSHLGCLVTRGKGEVSATEDPLLIAASMIDDVKG